MFPYFMIVLTFVLVVSFVVQPLFLEPGKKPEMEDRYLDALKLRKKVVYKQMKEAEMEFEMGNLPEEDFRRTYSQLKKEASEIIAQIKGRSERK